MTIFSKNLGGPWSLCPPWLRLCPTPQGIEVPGVEKFKNHCWSVMVVTEEASLALMPLTWHQCSIATWSLAYKASGYGCPHSQTTHDTQS